MKTKREFRFYTLAEYDKEQKYLERRHREGWKFVRVSGYGIYHFEKCEPCGYVYQLDYNKEGIKDRGEYIQMFADCGWEHVADYVGYSYFRKPIADMNGEEEIFDDNNSKVEMMQRIFVGKVIPLVVMIMLYLFLQFYLPKVLEGLILTVLLYVMRCILILYVMVMIHFFAKYFKYRRSIKK